MLLDWAELLFMSCSGVGVQNLVFINQGVSIEDPSLIHQSVKALFLSSEHHSVFYPSNGGFKLLDLLGKLGLH